jgi:hypothetical protein
MPYGNSWNDIGELRNKIRSWFWRRKICRRLATRTILMQGIVQGNY